MKYLHGMALAPDPLIRLRRDHLQAQPWNGTEAVKRLRPGRYGEDFQCPGWRRDSEAVIVERQGVVDLDLGLVGRICGQVLERCRDDLSRPHRQRPAGENLAAPF